MMALVGTALFVVSWTLEQFSLFVRMLVGWGIAAWLGVPNDVAQLIGLGAGIWPHFAAFSTLFGLPGGSGARWRLGARRPSQRERQIVGAALSRLGERRARLPRRWFVVDAPTFNASVLGTTLFVHREMIYSPYLEAVLAHECGHIEAGDSHLALALERFAFPGLPAVRSWLLRMEQPVLAAVVLAVSGGWAATLPGVMSSWRWYFRRREHKADRIARKLGYANQFAEYLDTHDLPLDAASPFMIGRTHPYAEQRIDRLSGER